MIGWWKLGSGSLWPIVTCCLLAQHSTTTSSWLCFGWDFFPHHFLSLGDVPQIFFVYKDDDPLRGKPAKWQQVGPGGQV